MGKVFKNTQEMLNSSAWDKARETREQELTYDEYDDIFEYVNNSIDETADRDAQIGAILIAIDEVTTQFNSIKSRL